jgi:serine/threonine protein phosphatase PrpC
MFVQIDQIAPAEMSVGSTTSVVLQYGPKVYFANAGDSRLFLVVYHAKSQSVQVVYISREDKLGLAEEGIFAISATNGMMEFATPETTTQIVLALSQYDKEGSHLLTALKELI